MTLKDQLRTDLTTALKARDTTRTSTLRMVLTAVSREEVAGDAPRTLSDDEVLDVVVREAKRRRESITAFEAAGRTELADRERAEAAVLAGYLPAALTPAEVSAMVTAAIAQTGAEGPRAMGQVMKAVQTQVRGRADGAAVAAEVRRQLSG